MATEHIEITYVKENLSTLVTHGRSYVRIDTQLTQYMNLFMSVLLLTAVLTGCSSCDNGSMPDNLAEIQDTVESYIKDDGYKDASNYLRCLNLERYLEEAAIASSGRIQYWAVMEDGVTVPGIAATIQVEDDAWVIPGTSDALLNDAHKAWQSMAIDVAREFNLKLESQVSGNNRQP